MPVALAHSGSLEADVDLGVHGLAREGGRKKAREGSRTGQGEELSRAFS